MTDEAGNVSEPITGASLRIDSSFPTIDLINLSLTEDPNASVPSANNYALDGHEIRVTFETDDVTAPENLPTPQVTFGGVPAQSITDLNNNR